MSDDPAPAVERVMVYVCPRCGFRSYHPMDLDQRYCVRCHKFEDDGE